MDELIKKEIEKMRHVQSLVEFRENQRPYHYDGRILTWGEDMPEGCIEAMKNESEVALLQTPDGKYLLIFTDPYDQIRQVSVNQIRQIEIK